MKRAVEVMANVHPGRLRVEGVKDIGLSFSRIFID
jgi:hypothetical protein